MTDDTVQKTRMQLLHLAHDIVAQKYNRQAEEIFWTAEKAGVTAVELPKYGVREVVEAARELDNFLYQH